MAGRGQQHGAAAAGGVAHRRPGPVGRDRTGRRRQRPVDQQLGQPPGRDVQPLGPAAPAVGRGLERRREPVGGRLGVARPVVRPGLAAAAGERPDPQAVEADAHRPLAAGDEAGHGRGPPPVVRAGEVDGPGRLVGRHGPGRGRSSPRRYRRRRCPGDFDEALLLTDEDRRRRDGGAPSPGDLRPAQPGLGTAPHPSGPPPGRRPARHGGPRRRRRRHGGGTATSPRAPPVAADRPGAWRLRHGDRPGWRSWGVGSQWSPQVDHVAPGRTLVVQRPDAGPAVLRASASAPTASSEDPEIGPHRHVAPL